MSNKLMNQKISVGQIHNSDLQIISQQLSDPNLIIKSMEQSMESIQNLKKEMTDQKIQKMPIKDKNMGNLYPCEYDYIVNENGKYFLVYGWKQTMIDLDFLPKQEKDQILTDFQQNKKYGQRINRLPLTDIQVYMFEMLLEQCLTQQVIEELQMLYRMKKIEPNFNNDANGLKKKYFEYFIKHPKFTIRVGQLKPEINAHQFCKDNNIDETICDVQKRFQKETNTCEILLSYATVRQYRQTFNNLKARGYDLQEEQIFNQTIQVLEVLKQLYRDAYAIQFNELKQQANSKEIINKHQVKQQNAQANLRSRSRSRSKSKSSSNSKSNSKSQSSSKSSSNTAVKTVSRSQTPVRSEISKVNFPQAKKAPYSPQKPFCLPIVKKFDDESPNKESVEKETIQNHNNETQTIPLIYDVNKLFTYLSQTKKYQNTFIPINAVKKGEYKTHQEILQLNLKYLNIANSRGSLSLQEEIDYSKIVTVQTLTNFIKHLYNIGFEIKEVEGLKLSYDTNFNLKKTKKNQKKQKKDIGSKAK